MRRPPDGPAPAAAPEEPPAAQESEGRGTTPTDYHDEFLRALPRIVTHAEFVFRSVRCLERRADYVSETIALSWKWWLRIREKGEKDPNDFVSAIASFAARAARCGRRVCGAERAKDVMNPAAQREKSFRVERLECSPRRSHLRLYAEPHGQRDSDAFEERLRDNTVTPPPEQAAFRIDYAAWVKTHDERRRRMLEAMVGGETTLGLSEQFGVSPGRVSQMRREFLESWRGYTEELRE